jgi:hypothetical protein
VTVTASRARPHARDRTAADRILAAAPLLTVFVWLSAVYAWQAWRHGSPWLFTDELQLTQLARSIAQSGHAARRGEPHSFNTLYTYLIAPAWRIGDAHQAYNTVKYINVVVMSAAAFPTYFLARFVVGRRASLFAAAGAIVIPSLVYTAMIVEEPAAYTYSTLCLYLIAGALLRRTRRWILIAAAASLLAPLVRGELIVIPAIFVLAALFVAWRAPQVTAWRTRWSTGDWLGAAVLVVGVAIGVSALLGHHSQQWLIATGFYKHRMFTLGLRAAGALTIGLGVFPLVAGLASLSRGPGEPRRVELRVFRSVLLAALIGFGTYTAVKASFISTTFGTYTVERNLIYLSPVLFVGTAVWLERRNAQPLAVAAAALFALYLVLTTPYEMQFHFYSQAPGFSILEWLNRTSLGLTPNQAKVLLVLILAASVVILLAPRFVPRAGLALALVAAAFALAWNISGQLAGASASNSFASSFLSNLRGNPTWLDRATGGAPTLYLGQQMQDQNSEWLLEFWNRSLKAVWSLDGTAQGPGPFLTPDLHATDGTLFPNADYAYVIADRGIRVAGQVLGVHRHKAGGSYLPWTLYRPSRPLRLRWAYVGVQPDGWMSSDSSYTRYWSPGNRAGTMTVLVSRKEWGGPDKRAKVTVNIGTVSVGPDKQPHIGRITETRTWTIHSKQSKLFVLHPPGPQFRVEVHVSPTFRPIDLSPQTTSDARQLGAVVTYRFLRRGARR